MRRGRRIHQANYLLDQQIAALEDAFVEGGGYTEQLAAKRLQHRRGERTEMPGSTESPDPPGDLPTCPQCAAAMVVRTVRSGERAGQSFLGCSAYPECKGTREL
ncbi:MAG: four helix bundle suffix domain-containing protein [Verrucomicrobiales bacterium]